MCVLAAQSCPTLCSPMDYNSPGSSVQAWILEWVAISFSRGSSQPRDQTQAKNQKLLSIVISTSPNPALDSKCFYLISKVQPAHSPVRTHLRPLTKKCQEAHGFFLLPWCFSLVALPLQEQGAPSRPHEPASPVLMLGSNSEGSPNWHTGYWQLFWLVSLKQCSLIKLFKYINRAHLLTQEELRLCSQGKAGLTVLINLTAQVSQKVITS